MPPPLEREGADITPFNPCYIAIILGRI